MLSMRIEMISLHFYCSLCRASLVIKPSSRDRRRRDFLCNIWIAAGVDWRTVKIVPVRFYGANTVFVQLHVTPCNVMQTNIKKVLERGDKMDTLNERSESLTSRANEFQINSRSILRKLVAKFEIPDNGRCEYGIGYHHHI
jgi:hypothetical protein